MSASLKPDPSIIGGVAKVPLARLPDPEAVFAKALGSGRETYLNLRPQVPVHLVYFTAFPDDEGRIHRYPDIYGRDALVRAALAKAGLQ